MKPTNHGKAPSRTPSAALIALAVMVLGGAALWWWSRPPVELNEDGYALTVALYRVCNQRSEEGLVQVEAQLLKLTPAQGPVDDSYRVVAATISKAKAGDWEQAARDCRQALEDQVKR